MQLLKCNKISIAFEDVGHGDPLILIMGLSARGAFWEDHLKEYAKHFRCIVVDNRGAGDSDKPDGPYTTKMMADDIAELINQLDLPKVHVAGISMGGAIAQELAIQYPSLIQSLTLISTWAKLTPHAAQAFSHLKDMRKTAAPAEFMKLLQLWIFSPPYYQSAENRTSMDEGCQTAHENYMELHAFCAQADACISHDSLERAATIKAPTLITVGDLDIFTPIEFSRQLHELIAGSSLCEFEGAGHAHHWEDLQSFNARTIEFMLEHAIPAGASNA